MKSSFVAVFILILALVAAPFVNASAWDLWAPVLPKVDLPAMSLLWSDFTFIPSLPSGSNSSPTPSPTPDPEPTLPIGPADPAKNAPEGPIRKVPFPNLSLSSDEMNLIQQVNQERLKGGAGALQIDQDLVVLAKTKSHDMAVYCYFDHVSPNFGKVQNMLDQAGVSYIRAGENIAKTGSFARIHPLFMGSSGHRANIMNPNFTHIGIGIVYHGTSFYVTQIFVTR